MKTQLLLSLLQIGLLLFLFGKIAAIDNELNAVTSGEHARAQEDAAYQQQADISAGRSPDNAIESRLRTIVREELAAQLAALPSPGSPDPANVAAVVIDEDEYRHQYDLVAQKLDLYESVGGISEWDVQKLHAEIIKLNAADRKRAFGRLARTISLGGVRGQQ